MFSAVCSIARDPEGDFKAFGHSSIMSPWGEALSQADETEQIIIAEIDLSIIAEMRQNLPYLSKKRPDIYAQVF